MPASQATRLVIGVLHRAFTLIEDALGRAPARPASAWDVVAGTGAVLTEGAAFGGRVTMSAARPFAKVLLHPPLVPPPAQPGAWLESLARRGRLERVEGGRDVELVVDAVIPVIVDRVVTLADLTALVRKHVDLDEIVAGVDLDAVVSRVDLDTIAARIDVEAIVERLDLTQLVRERVDINAIVADVDLDTIAGRIDVDAVAARLDIEAVIARMDLAGLAEQVMDAIDLPEIIRESTGSMASEAVRDVRMQSIEADEAVSRVVDRLFLRRRKRRPAEIAEVAATVPAGEPEQVPPVLAQLPPERGSDDAKQTPP